ncbi:MAG: dihydropteroate synthase [SAR324 cluster bacterium]|nr:dihydropteroate synthase [SAR324 cluster bacterium]
MTASSTDSEDSRRPADGSLLPAPPWRVGAASWEFREPLIMGVLNATPDSFSDGGEFLELDAALRRAQAMVSEQADIIDLGGASSHPLAKPVSTEEELGRILPIVERLVGNVPLPLSIDTQKPEVAEACLKLGAQLINDVSGLTDLEMARVAARHGVPLVVMYNNFALPRAAGGPPLMEAMGEFFATRIAQAEAEGLTHIILDPGYGFGKSLQDNMLLLRQLGQLHGLHRPLLVCTSRKGSLGRITGEKDPKKRLPGTLVSTLFAVNQGAHMIRVHDVKAIHQAMRTWRAIQQPTPDG